MSQLSVIIPTYGRPDNLIGLLKKLNKQTFKDFEVIVIDSNEVNYDYYKEDYFYYFYEYITINYTLIVRQYRR